MERAMEAELSLEFLRVVENAAIAAARTMGFGDSHKGDEVAVEAMRKTMDSLAMDGTIVKGEGGTSDARAQSEFSGGGYCGRSAGGNEFMRYRGGEFDRGAGS